MSLKISDNLIEHAHISAGGVAPIPLYLQKTSEFLRGREVSETTIAEANEILQTEVSPISDVRGSADYKRLLLRQLFYGAFYRVVWNLIHHREYREFMAISRKETAWKRKPEIWRCKRRQKLFRKLQIGFLIAHIRLKSRLRMMSCQFLIKDNPSKDFYFPVNQTEILERINQLSLKNPKKILRIFG